MFKLRVFNVVIEPEMKAIRMTALLALVGILSACGGGGGGGGGGSGGGGGFGADGADTALMTADLSGAARAQPATMGALEAN